MNAACSSSRNCSGTPSAVRCRQGRGRFQGKAQPQLSEAQASAADPANPRPLQLGLDLIGRYERGEVEPAWKNLMRLFKVFGVQIFVPEAAEEVASL